MLSPTESPFGKHETISIGSQVLGNDSESEGTQEALSEVLADHSTDDGFNMDQSGRWGTITLRTHCREGEAGYDVLMNEMTEDTL